MCSFPCKPRDSETLRCWDWEAAASERSEQSPPSPRASPLMQELNGRIEALLLGPVLRSLAGKLGTG